MKVGINEDGHLISAGLHINQFERFLDRTKKTLKNIYFLNLEKTFFSLPYYFILKNFTLSTKRHISHFKVLMIYCLFNFLNDNLYIFK